MKTMASIIWILAAAVAMRASGKTSSDDELKREILLFMRPIECVEMVRGQPHRPRVLTEKISFDGDTNRLARLLAEIAQTNNVQIAQRSMELLGEYGTPAQLPFLYSCATNPAVGDKAVKAVLRIEGVTSNSLALVQSYVSLTNGFPLMKRDNRSDVCGNVLKRVFADNTLSDYRTFVMDIACGFAGDVNVMPKGMDKTLVEVEPGFRFTKRRLAILRSAQVRLNERFQGMDTNGVHFAAESHIYDVQTNFLASAINELVAYPEANLPD